MIRKAEVADIGALAAFLEGHVTTSMFLLGNLESHGLDNTDHPHGTAYFLRETGDGITGVFGATNGGFLMCQLPGLTPAEAQTYAHLLKGYTLRGMTGHAAQVTTMLEALAVPDDLWQLNRVEPLYALDLGGPDQAEQDLAVSGGAAAVRAVTEADLPVLSGWFAAYMTETETVPPGLTAETLPEAAAQRAASTVGAAHVRVLEEDGALVAMAALNAQAGPAVQVGGVYVPPALRGGGRAGRVVAGLLAEAQVRGRSRAILFAASLKAARAYEKIGFARVGDYRIALLRSAYEMGHAT